MPEFFNPPPIGRGPSSSATLPTTLPTRPNSRAVRVEISEGGRKKLNRILHLEFTFTNLQPARQVAGGMEIVEAMTRAFHTAPGDAFSITEDGKLVFTFDHETQLCECTFKGPKIETVEISNLEKTLTLDLSSRRERSPPPIQREWIEAKRLRTAGGENLEPGGSASPSAPAPARSTEDHQTNEYGEMILPNAAVAGPASDKQKGKQPASISADGLPDESTATTQPQPEATTGHQYKAAYDVATYSSLMRTQKRQAELKHYGYAPNIHGLKAVSERCDAVPAKRLEKDGELYVHYNVPLGVNNQPATVLRRIDGNGKLKDLRIVVSGNNPDGYTSWETAILCDMFASKKHSATLAAAKPSQARQSRGLDP